MEGGRILNRTPQAFLTDGLTTHSNLSFTPMDMYTAFYNGAIKQKKNVIPD